MNALLELEQARQTLTLEAEAILALAARLGPEFTQAVELLFRCQGRVVVTGMGKSGLIGRKIAATMASTGTPALFLHPAEGSHGDLGMLTTKDVVIAISSSGESWEVTALLPIIKRLGVPVIGLTGKAQSTLARCSDVVLDISVEREACPLGLAPTCSTTVTLALGDALAVALLDKRKFDMEQFAQLHPGGALGRRLLMRVAEQMHKGEQIPLVRENDGVRRALIEITSKRLGMTGVQNEQGQLVGIITDGDLRRHLEHDDQLLTRTAGAIMTRAPRTIPQVALAAEAIKRMQDAKITSLFVVDEHEALSGVIHLHDLLAAGLT